MACNKDFSQCFKGKHEVQECIEGQGETDLHTHLVNCQKNPGHTELLPVKYLPFDNIENDTYDLIKALADITVRIAVNFTSPDRPEFVPGTKDPYPCYNSRSKNLLRTGTGRVWGLIECTNTSGNDCPCPECDISITPKKRTWWQIEVRTARHVVFDSSEARQSSCRLWFDEENSPVVNIYGLRVGGSHTARDSCVMTCVTHNIEIGDKLKVMLSRFNSISMRVRNKYESRREEDKLTIIVSHPHGCSKQVSVGHWVERQAIDSNCFRYIYTTCTCPGSSGAQVYRLGCRSPHTHSGTTGSGLNYSGCLWD